MLEFVGEFFKSLAKPKPTENIFANEDEIVREISDGTIERVCWKDLRKVTIVTTDGGPWLEDVFFVFESHDTGVVIAQEWEQKLGLLDLMKKKLSGIDYEQMIAAMGCTDNARFPIWDAAANAGTLETST